MENAGWTICLNPPKGPPTISTTVQDDVERYPQRLVSIPRRVRRRFPRSQAATWHVMANQVSIPRRVRRRFPQPSLSTKSGSVTESQSPEGSADDFHPLLLEIQGLGQWQCLNPPKGPPTISTWHGPQHPQDPVSIPRRVRRRFPLGRWLIRASRPTELSQSPEGSADDFHLLTGKLAGKENEVMSQSPEGSADDFHGEVFLRSILWR